MNQTRYCSLWRTPDHLAVATAGDLDGRVGRKDG